MDLPVIIVIAVGLAMDAFSVAIATSVRFTQVSKGQIFRFAFHFGLFQALMPVLGWAGGRSVEPYIRAWDHWLAFALLLGIGIKAIYQALHTQPQDAPPPSDPTRGYSLLIYSLATSIDALAVGLTFAFIDVAIWYPCLLIGLITAFLTTLGMLLGAKLGATFGKRIEILGGLVLIGIGIKIVLDHTL